MTLSFNVHDAAGYEQVMGRWSKKLAPLFIDFAGLANGEKVLDVGCGTGSLTFTLTKFADLGEISAIDYSPVFVEAANRRNTDPRIKIQQADACALPFEDDTFDRALALLVLHFVPEAGKAVAEMRRVVRPGGVVAAAVWDHLGGMSGMRMMVDTVAVLTEGGRQLRNRYCFQPMMQPSGRPLMPRCAMPTRPAALTDRGRLQMLPGPAGASFPNQRPTERESFRRAPC